MHFPTGVYVPLVTPFKDGSLDRETFHNLVRHVLADKPAGLMLFGTTAERLLMSDEEEARLAKWTMTAVAGDVPVYFAVNGASTSETITGIQRLERFEPTGYLVGTPYYVRPNQDGLAAHFTACAAATPRPCLVYNIPFRTGTNVENDTMFHLFTTVENIVGVKDVCGRLEQSFDLLLRRPDGMSVLAGQDPHYFACLTHGADGGVLASGHTVGARLVSLTEAARANDLKSARAIWQTIRPVIDAMFVEPSPVGVKEALRLQGVIDNADCRAPLTGSAKHSSDLLAAALRAL